MRPKSLSSEGVTGFPVFNGHSTGEQDKEMTRSRSGLWKSVTPILLVKIRIPLEQVPDIESIENRVCSYAKNKR